MLRNKVACWCSDVKLLRQEPSCGFRLRVLQNSKHPVSATMLVQPPTQSGSASPPGLAQQPARLHRARQRWTCRGRCVAQVGVSAAVHPTTETRQQVAPQQLQQLDPQAPAQLHAAKQPVNGTYLQKLTIQNFALIESQEVTFLPGLNVITGESGAGKSVLIEALNQVLGLPASEESVRPPADRARVHATFHLSTSAQAQLPSLLHALGVPRRALAQQHRPNELVLLREITAEQGLLRSRCYVNGVATSLRVLREIGIALVDVNGQHAAQTVRSAGTQLALLDRIAGTSADARLFGARLQQLRSLREQLQAVEALGSEDARDQLQHLVDTVSAEDLTSGEDRTLRSRLRQLEARRYSIERAGLVHSALSGDGGVGGLDDMLRTVRGHLQAIAEQEQAYSAMAGSDEAGDDPSDAPEADPDTEESIEDVEAALAAIEEAQQLLQEADSKAGAYARRWRYLQQEHDEVAERLQQVELLMRQFDCTSADELLELSAQAEADLDAWFAMEGNKSAQEAEANALQHELAAAAVQLSSRRREAAGRLRAAVEGCLADLGMGGCRFDVMLRWQPAAAHSSDSLHVSAEHAAQAGEPGEQDCLITPSGLDTAEFLLSAGPSEPLRSLAATASGGESARVMLALKAAPAAIAPVANDAAGAADQVLGGHESMIPGIMILDELDSGVGGRLGAPVGRMLRRMVLPQAGGRAATSQILCVSHLPQVAAHAEHHLRVTKDVDDSGRVITKIEELLDNSQRLKEISAMLGLGEAEAQHMLEAGNAV